MAYSCARVGRFGTQKVTPRVRRPFSKRHPQFSVISIWTPAKNYYKIPHKTRRHRFLNRLERVVGAGFYDTQRMQATRTNLEARCAEREPDFALPTWYPVAKYLATIAFGLLLGNFILSFLSEHSAARFVLLQVILLCSIIWVRRAVARHRAALHDTLRENDFQICLRCGYPLTHLPANYQCPECGTPFDVFETRRRWRRWNESCHARNSTLDLK